jgi:threonine dehydrogenase-like Zn-dependent dehydrogenase
VLFLPPRLACPCENSNPNYGPEGGLLKQKGAALFGYTNLYGGYDGGQAQYVRVPYANFGPRKVSPDLSDEQVLFLTDIFPTGYSGVDWAGLEGGETVVVFGCGPVGLMAQKVAWLKGAGRVIGVDKEDYRLETARRTANAETINFEKTDPVEAIRQLTSGGVRTSASTRRHGGRTLDARQAGQHHPPAARLDQRPQDVLQRRAARGFVSILGVYGMPYDNFPIGQMFDKGIRIAQGQAPVHRYIDELIRMVEKGDIVLNDIITHRLPLSQVSHGYEIFKHKQDNCVKVVLDPTA